MSSLSIAVALISALLVASAMAMGIRALHQRLTQENAALKRELAEVRKYTRARDPWTESIVDEVCQRHPALTREEARAAIDASGF
ncbi:hypothetical protein BH09GEM1_BH09GEM1_45270 [soil metagenome]